MCRTEPQVPALTEYRPAVTLLRLSDEQGERVHLLRGGAGEPGNWSVTLAPTPPGPAAVIVATVLAALAPGWADRARAHGLPAWDEVNRVLHVGTTIHHGRYLLDVMRSYRPDAELPASATRLAVIEQVRAELGDDDDARRLTVLETPGLYGHDDDDDGA